MAGVVRKHVLVVDDDQDSREMVSAVLESYGFTTSTAGDADDAVGIARAGGVAAIVTDIRFAGCERDGLWLLREVASLEIPAVTLTGEAERRDELQRLGFAAVLIKPADLDSLVGVLHSVVANAAKF